MAIEVIEDFVDEAPKDSSVDFASTWNIPPVMSTSGMGTDPIPVDAKETQTTTYITVATQVDANMQAKGSKADKIGGSQLSRMGQLMSDEMDRARLEHDMLDPFTRVGDEQDAAVLGRTLTAFADPSSIAHGVQNSSKMNDHHLTVTCLSWSATGQTIAASFGRYDIVGWCNYKGYLATWNLGRDEVNEGKPDHMIETDNCLQCCSFHPTHPALIAGGTFNGELCIWDLSHEGDPLRGKSDGLSDMRHTEPITAIEWQYSMSEKGKYGNNEKAYRVITLSNDGRVLIWIWHKLEHPQYGYVLLWPQPGGSSRVMWGGSCMSFQHDQMNARAEAVTFVVGTEGGKIFKCYSDMNDAQCKEFLRAVTAGEKVDMKVPIKDTEFHMHAGAIYGIECSPFQRDCFLTCGADSTVRLYSTLKAPSLMVVEPANSYLYNVRWSPFRPLVFATSAGDGRVYIYDLLNVRDIVQPVMVLDVNISGLPVYSLAFNPKKPQQLATADSNGIQIWELPASLTELRRGEDMVLKKMATAENVDAAMRQQGLK